VADSSAHCPKRERRSISNLSSITAGGLPNHTAAGGLQTECTGDGRCAGVQVPACQTNTLTAPSTNKTTKFLQCHVNPKPYIQMQRGKNFPKIKSHLKSLVAILGLAAQNLVATTKPEPWKSWVSLQYSSGNRDSSVGIATRYGLDAPGIECRWGRDYQHLSKSALGPTQPPIQLVLDLFLGDKAAGAWR
jgi:hypothetical protein